METIFYPDELEGPFDSSLHPELNIPSAIKYLSLGINNGYITIPYSRKLNKDGFYRKLENKEESFIISNLKIEDMVNKLATNFAKEKDSNNYKLLYLAYVQLKKLEDDLNRQLDWLDINKAKGYALDLIGKRVGILRGLMDDDKYRVKIKSKISENLSDGTVNAVIQALALALNINVDKVHIRPLFPEGKPATIIIENIPASSLNKAGITQEELVDMTQKIIANGVRVESINLEGTFRFSPIRNQVVVNAATGLSDVAMTTGGKLGAILSVN